MELGPVIGWIGIDGLMELELMDGLRPSSRMKIGIEIIYPMIGPVIGSMSGCCR